MKRAFFAGLIADGDMHLKNMALIETDEPGDRQFRTVRMAPASCNGCTGQSRPSRCPKAVELTDETQKMTAEVLELRRRRVEAMAQPV